MKAAKLRSEQVTIQQAGSDCEDTWENGRIRKPALLSIEEAMQRAASLVAPAQKRERVPLAGSLGRRVSVDIEARLDLPPFDQSAMDGFALAGATHHGAYALADWEGARAGTIPGRLAQGQATHIATGSRVPEGADRVVLQEHATREDRHVVLRDCDLEAGANIRKRGEDVRRGDVLISEGIRIDARKVALLAAQGITEVDVISRPRVAIVSSGNELRQPGEQLGYADVYDSNRPMLVALAMRAGAEVSDAGCCRDDAETLSRLVFDLCQDNEFVIVSGGTSVGNGDIAAVALRAAGADVQELRIAMKPGKPAMVGRLGNASILGLPGNPFAAFVSWSTLGLAMMTALSHCKTMRRVRLPVLNELRRRSGRTEFAPARYVQTEQGDSVEFLGRGGSGRLYPLACADGLVVVEAERGDILSGEMVSFMAFTDGEELYS